MKISPRDMLIAAVVAVLIVAVALVVLLILPQNKRLKSLDSQIKQAEQQQQQSEELLARRQDAKQRAAVTAAELLRLSNAVPDSPEMPALIIELQNLTAESGLQFRSLTPEDPAVGWQVTGAGATPAPFDKLPMKMQVYGSWSDTVDFLQRVQRLPRQLRVTLVQSQKADTPPEGAPDPGPKYPVLTDLTLEAYVLPSSATSATP